MITRISLGLAIAAALPLAAQAHEAAAPASLPVADAAAIAAADTNQIVIVRDADTGRLRPATPEEHNALKALPANANARARVASRAAAMTPLLKQHRSGAVGVRLTDDMVSQSVMVRGADGKLIEACFASKEEAEAFMKNGGAVAKSALPTE
ncbi:post-PEP-CTERM-1 domain-containing protein [Roseateles sp. UC29_93]|uniref:post-PEP-CTERM-1 domain-containing protein n=1 Tax=Roseateles sp. UC29_93 TaxID=3350177 RepID=UPI00366A97F4